MVDLERLKILRAETSVSLAECEKALEESKGDIDLAREILKKWGKKIAEKKAGRKAGEGRIASYVHYSKKIGVLLDIGSESDFVAKSEEFQKLANEICLQIASMGPLFLSKDEIPEEFLDGERKIYQEQLKDSGKPKKIIDEIVEGKLEKYRKDVSLLFQPWVKDESRSIKDLINDYIAKTGENIVIRRFTRYEI